MLASKNNSKEAKLRREHSTHTFHRQIPPPKRKFRGIVYLHVRLSATTQNDQQSKQRFCIVLRRPVPATGILRARRSSLRRTFTPQCHRNMKHLQLLTRLNRLEAVLDKRCQMLRSVEKLLLTKFKDTSTTPLSHMDALLDMTHRQVFALSSSLTSHNQLPYRLSPSPPLYKNYKNTFDNAHHHSRQPLVSCYCSFNCTYKVTMPKCVD